MSKAASERREKLRREFWPDGDPWTGADDKGWFKAPRTLPLILEVLNSKEISGKIDLTRVYIDLFSRHIDNGIVEMTHEADHAFASGYSGSRGVRTWQERMTLLEENGFIESKEVGNQRYRYVLLVHPTTVIHKLRNAGKISEPLWSAYRSRQIEIKEETYEEREAKRVGKLVSINRPKGASAEIEEQSSDLETSKRNAL